MTSQGQDPLFPTVVPAPDFDPDKDAARIETAIKTKGKISLSKKRKKGKRNGAWFCKFLQQMSDWYLWVSLMA